MLLAALVTFAGFVRLAASDPTRSHVAPEAAEASGEVQECVGGATLRLSPEAVTASDLLHRLDATAMTPPRSSRLAGTVEDGRITWVARSALWGAS